MTRLASSQRYFQTSTKRAQEAAQEAAQEEEATQNGVATTFKELGRRQQLHPCLLKALTQEMGINEMTDIQILTVHKGLEGNDM